MTSADDDTLVLPVVPPAALEEAPAEPEWRPAAHDEDDFHPGPVGRVARRVCWVLLAWSVVLVPANLLSPLSLDQTTVTHLTEAVIFAIIGLSLNVLIGYAGQISLGHQAFVGIGAFTTAYLVTEQQLDFFFALLVAAVFGGLQAAILGAVSLRVTGLYFALVTLAYGAFAEQTVFGIESLTRGEAGMTLTRPSFFASEERYYLLCLGFLVLVVWLDWRLTRSTAGRALAALRENPRVASSYGINVKAYMMVAFVVAGVFAGLGGGLFAARQSVIVPTSFGFTLGLTFVLMTVVGGLRNRTGVIIGAAFFALLGSGELVHWLHLDGFFAETIGLPVQFVPLVVGPILLLLTITLHPGGIGQQVAPIQGWLAGRRLDRHAGKVREVEVSDVRA
ncbi:MULTISPECIES: branched-chain amino acid ABC transporter permease [Nocardioides]|uniref:Branched-chain amino acid ABC transporter permease n=1 Tax=Nocardioides vastitatis TaxID=2568655 RepID=A0ABW0ZE66_9ACTN|nr:branched-chain amino acid ABC transporter permease [Nocardioides sp.]THI94791.1 branched-chain amino acid ABC transporter permease [Nocardioides sp.]